MDMCPCLRKCGKKQIKTTTVQMDFGGNFQQNCLFSHVGIYFLLLPKTLDLRKRGGRRLSVQIPVPDVENH